MLGGEITPHRALASSHCASEVTQRKPIENSRRTCCRLLKLCSSTEPRPLRNTAAASIHPINSGAFYARMVLLVTGATRPFPSEIMVYNTLWKLRPLRTNRPRIESYLHPLWGSGTSNDTVLDRQARIDLRQRLWRRRQSRKRVLPRDEMTPTGYNIDRQTEPPPALKVPNELCPRWNGAAVGRSDVLHGASVVGHSSSEGIRFGWFRRSVGKGTHLPPGWNEWCGWWWASEWRLYLRGIKTKSWIIVIPRTRSVQCQDSINLTNAFWGSLEWWVNVWNSQISPISFHETVKFLIYGLVEGTSFNSCSNQSDGVDVTYDDHGEMITAIWLSVANKIMSSLK